MNTDKELSNSEVREMNMRLVIHIYPDLKEEYEKTGDISAESILSHGPRTFNSDEEIDDLFEDGFH